MSYTAETLANDAYELLRTRNPKAEPSLIPRLITLVPTALTLLAERVAQGPGYKGLQIEYTATPIAGVVGLAGLPQILFDINRSPVRIASSNAVVQAIDSYETLEHGDLPNDRVYFAQDGSDLRFRSTTPSLVDFVSPVKIRSNYIPLLINTIPSLPLPDQYEPLAVETLVEVAGMSVAKDLVMVGRA